MSLGDLLNADMATLGASSRAGLRWWLEELRGLVPARWRSRQGLARAAALYDGTPRLGMLDRNGRAEWVPGRRGRPLDLAVDARLALIRELDLVRMGSAEVRHMAALEADRLFPLPAHQVYVDAEIADARPDGRMMVRIAGLPRSIADAALAAAAEAGIAPGRIGLAVPGQAGTIAFDFAPALRADGRLPPPSRAPLLWWAGVAAMILLNVALLVVRDHQSVDRLAALVAAQGPGVAVGRLMQRRIGDVERLSGRTLTRRWQLDPLADLGAATRALTDDIWVQRLVWDGASMELAGYRQPRSDVLAELRRERRFANVRLSTSDVNAAALVGEPFDVTADLRGDRP